MKLRFETAGDKKRVDASVGSEMFGGGARFHWFGEYHVAVEIVDNEEIRVAGAGRCDKAASGIGEQLARNGGAVDVYCVSAKGIGLCCLWVEIKESVG